MVRYIILRKNLLLIPQIVAFRKNSASAWFLQREGHLRTLKRIPRLATCSPPPTARTEEEGREKIGTLDRGAANSTIIQECNTYRVGHALRNPQTSPSDTCPYTCKIMDQNVNGLKADDKLEKIISMMIVRNIQGYCMQETWMLGDFILKIRGHTVIHHGMQERKADRGRYAAGVGIVLGPFLTGIWEKTGKLPPVTSPITSPFPGRMIGITLCFPNGSNRSRDRYHRKAKGEIKIFLCSIYHPVEHDEQKYFNDELDAFYGRAPRNAEILSGQDINANAGVATVRFRDVIGPNGINNRNVKGKDFLFLLKSNKLKLLLTFFKHRNYITYRSFNQLRTPHMLDNFVCSEKFFKRVKDCKVVSTGVRSDHSAIQVTFKLTSIKFKVNAKKHVIIDWKKINNNPIVNKQFNDKLTEVLTKETDYTNFNLNILKAAKETATTSKQKNNGWFQNSEETLLPIIEARDRILSMLRESKGQNLLEISALKKKFT